MNAMSLVMELVMNAVRVFITRMSLLTHVASLVMTVMC